MTRDELVRAIFKYPNLEIIVSDITKRYTLAEGSDLMHLTPEGDLYLDPNNYEGESDPVIVLWLGDNV